MLEIAVRNTDRLVRDILDIELSPVESHGETDQSGSRCHAGIFSLISPGRGPNYQT